MKADLQAGIFIGLLLGAVILFTAIAVSCWEDCTIPDRFVPTVYK